MHRKHDQSPLQIAPVAVARELDQQRRDMPPHLGMQLQCDVFVVAAVGVADNAVGPVGDPAAICQHPLPEFRILAASARARAQPFVVARKGCAGSPKSA
jgi:hypothetical protein